MLRYIMKAKWRDGISNASGESLYTIDGDAKLVEEMLQSGGRGEAGYEIHELVGVEIIETKESDHAE